MATSPASPKFTEGQQLRLSVDSGSRSAGKVKMWSAGTFVTVDAILPSREWGDPSWPRYVLRYPDNSTGSLDESHLLIIDDTDQNRIKGPAKGRTLF